MRRALAKPHVRVVAVDDGPFRRRQRWAPIAAVVVAGPAEVEGVHVDRVTVDGDDATDRLVALLAASPHRPGLRAILLDGPFLGGFNVLDLDRIHRSLGLPVVTVTRRAPDLARIRAALATYFPADHRRRWRRVVAHRLFPVPTDGRPILAAAVGCSRADARALLGRLTRRGHWPEPLRLARLVARALAPPAPVRTLKPRRADVPSGL